MADPVPVALDALNATLDVPAAWGMPEMTPVDVLTESPGGSPVALKLVGLLLAVIVYLNDVPTVPVALKALVIEGGAEAGGENRTSTQ